MSRRELYALDTDTCVEVRMRSGTARLSRKEAGMEHFKAQLAKAQRDLTALSEEVEQLNLVVQQARLEAEVACNTATAKQLRWKS